MALNNPIYMARYRAPAGGGGTVIEVTSGGVNSIDIEENVSSSALPSSDWVKNVFVWGGNIWIPQGNYVNSSLGWISYNPRTNKFQFASDASYLVRSIPMGAYIGVLQSTAYQRGTSPLYRSLKNTAAPNVAATDYATLGNTVFYTSAVGNIAKWTYPFGSAPTSSAFYASRLCAFQGVMYGVYVDTGVSYLSKWNGSAWVGVGAGFTLPEASDVNRWKATYVSFFEWGGELWLITCYNTGGTYWHRCFKVNTTTGGITEISAATYLPAAWTGSPNNTVRRIFEVIDDTGAARQVFLVAHNYTTGGWGMYEFRGEIEQWPEIATGVDVLGTSAGAIWDKATAKGVHVTNAVDSVPSSYATLDLSVSSLRTNATVDVDVRHQDLTDSSHAPPYTACTEKNGVGSSGLTGLSSAPSTPAALTNLSDDFADGTIDTGLWAPVNTSINHAVRDYGVGGNGLFWHALSEESGAITFGGTAPAPSIVANTGVGIRSKWCISGAFNIDVTIYNLARLVSDTTNKRYKLFLLVKESTNKGYGIFVYNNAGTRYAQGIRFDLSAAPVLSAVPRVILEGDSLRIARDGANAWTLTSDYGVGDDDVTPAGAVAYSGDVQIWLGACTGLVTNWANNTPGPGFSDLAVSGAGTIGLWEPDTGLATQFMWDHITDLGAGFNGGVQLHGDIT